MSPEPFVDVVMTRLPHPEGEFVELEDPQGRGLGPASGTRWVKEADGYWRLRIPLSAMLPPKPDKPEVKKIRVIKDDHSVSTVVEVDGVNVAAGCTGIRYDAKAGTIPNLHLTLIPDEAVFDTEGLVRADVSERLTNALIAAGWTPPTQETS